MQKNFGVTLIELVVILGILILLTALAVPTFIFFQTETDLNNSTEEIINTLRVAQNKTLGSEGASNYGVHFESDKLVLFKGTSYDSLAIDNEVHSLPKRVEIYEINLLGGGLEVIFNKIVGATSQPGNINLRLEGEVTKIRTIGIQSSGKITLGQEANPIALPQKDSRHVHFNLGWPIQSATTLKFYFPAIPQTELVDMANYFNAGKTEFDWDNENSPFLVGGADQVFRIHTHSLDSFNTLLCIHRDRNNGKNNQEVIIYIVDGGTDKDIAHYLADSVDTVEKGFYANIMERQ